MRKLFFCKCEQGVELFMLAETRDEALAEYKKGFIVPPTDFKVVEITTLAQFMKLIPHGETEFAIDYRT